MHFLIVSLTRSYMSSAFQKRNQTAEGRIGGPLISRFLTSFFEIVYNTVSLFPLVKIVYFYVWAIFVRVVPSKWANLLTIWLQVLVQIPPGRFPFSEALPSQKNFITGMNCVLHMYGNVMYGCMHACMLYINIYIYILS